MELILNDYGFYDELRLSVGSEIRENGPGDILSAVGFRGYDFDEIKSNHLWSAFHTIRYSFSLDGDVCELAQSLEFHGSVEISFKDNWDFSNPANDGRKPFYKYALPQHIRDITEGRFRRLESIGWVHPFLVDGTYRSKGTIAVDKEGSTAASISLDSMPRIHLE